MSVSHAVARSPGLLGARTRVLFAFAVLLAISAVLFRTSAPLFAALVLLLAPIAAGLRAPARPLSGSLRWSVEGGTSEVRVRGRLELSPEVSSSRVGLRFTCPGPLVERSPIQIVAIRNNLDFALDWEASGPCLTQIPLPRASWKDPLGLVEIAIAIHGSPLTVERFPPEVSRVGSVRLRRTTPLPGEVRSRAIGAAGEFFSVRAAVASDTSRQINWRATARQGRRMANDFLLERTGDLLILLDVRPTSLGPSHDAQLTALGRAAALGIASGFLREKARVGLGVFDEFLRAVPLGTGRLQRFRIARLLEQVTSGTATGPSERFAVSVRRYFPPGVSTLVISSLVDDDSEELLLHLRRRGFPPFVLSPSPVPFLAASAPRESTAGHLAVRLLRLMRRQRLNEIWREAPVVEWDDYWSLVPLVKFLSSPVRNRRWVG